MMTVNDLPRGACVQLTPSYPPMCCGVGDYAAVLSQQIKTLGGNLYTVVAGKGSITLPGNNKNVIGTNPLLLPLVLQPATTVFLHFSGYGYHRHGLCDWLVDVLQDWRTGSEKRRLVTMFHETYATGPIWRRSFWTSEGQKRIAGQISRLSDVCLVSSLSGAEHLQRVSPTVSTSVMPVFSNIGEVQNPLSLQDREPVAVVFGTLGRRKAVFDALCRRGFAGSKHLMSLGIRKIIDIGPGDAVSDISFGLELCKLGRLQPQDVASVLTTSRVGLLDYSDMAIYKSGVFAAYLSHGMLAVNTHRCQHPVNGGMLGKAYLELNDCAALYCQEKIAAFGHEWYQGHSASETSRLIFSILNAHETK